MPLSSVQIAPLIIKMTAPLYIGAGYRRGLIHRTIVRDERDHVYLPASSLKGKVRAACEALLPTVGLPPCQSPYPQQMTVCRQNNCLVCRVFGAPGQGPELIWHDAHLTTWPEDAYGQTSIRTQVQLSRARGIAAEAYLYTGEATAPNLVFRSDRGVTGRLELTPMEGDPDLPYELILLLAGLRLVRTLGGETSRGMGHCVIELPPNVRVDDRRLPVGDLLTEVEYLALWEEEKGGSS